MAKLSLPWVILFLTVFSSRDPSLPHMLGTSPPLLMMPRQKLQLPWPYLLCPNHQLLHLITYSRGHSLLSSAFSLCQQCC
ncbi:hypothetical protein I79_011750 [Cricetulus griseus]|uniref:Uncharacterized protein n=1 Tax=Cricetulus griseus TaxID=10029 RepID=G3HM06_CRIGR|nr:hypothetical protein I79_011750 [Cricetulus griseus]